MPERHLQSAPEPGDEIPAILVDPATGQTYDVRSRFQVLEDSYVGAERDLRTWRARYADLHRDKEGEARESELWPVALRVFDYWRKQCRHPGAEWTLERFEMIRPFLERSNTGKGKATKLSLELVARNEELCKLAIDGIAFDPYVTIGKNGREIRHDGLHLIFGEKFEARCKAAPVERIREVFPPKPIDAQTALP